MSDTTQPPTAIEPGPGKPADSPLAQVGAQLNADLFLFSAGIFEGAVVDFMRQIPRKPNRPNVAVFLTTLGGDPDMAYRLARLLKRRYKRFTLFVLGVCKSAGTLIALGADELVMSDDGELGPLDVQLYKQDELSSLGSGLDIFKALDVLGQQAFRVFEQHFLGIIQRSGGNISTRTAADIARHVAPQLLAPIAGQIDPARLGELQRAITIAKNYGERLGGDPNAVQQLIYNYPSHGFIIDIDEAKGLFRAVREPNDAEWDLECTLRRILTHATGMDCLAEQHPQGLSRYLNPLADVPSAGKTVEDPDAPSTTTTTSPDEPAPDAAAPDPDGGPGSHAAASLRGGGDHGAGDRRDHDVSPDQALTLVIRGAGPTDADQGPSRRNGVRGPLS